MYVISVIYYKILYTYITVYLCVYSTTRYEYNHTSVHGVLHNYSIWTYVPWLGHKPSHWRCCTATVQLLRLRMAAAYADTTWCSRGIPVSTVCYDLQLWRWQGTSGLCLKYTIVKYDKWQLCWYRWSKILRDNVTMRTRSVVSRTVCIRTVDPWVSRSTESQHRVLIHWHNSLHRICVSRTSPFGSMIKSYEIHKIRSRIMDKYSLKKISAMTCYILC